MNSNCTEDEQEINKLNGYVVYNALAFMKNSATEREMTDFIIEHSGQPNDLVIQEVRRVLRNGVDNGFIVNVGNKFTLPSLEGIFHLDGDEEGCATSCGSSCDGTSDCEKLALEEDSESEDAEMECGSDPASAAAVCPPDLPSACAITCTPAGSPVKVNVTYKNTDDDGIAFTIDLQVPPPVQSNEECTVSDNEGHCEESPPECS